MKGISRTNSFEISAIVFDFDGVIVDSEASKRAAWSLVFSNTCDPSGFDWNSIDTHHFIDEALSRWVDGPVLGSRYEIIEDVLTAVDYTRSPENIALFARAYDAEVQKLVVSTGISADVRTYLASLSERRPLYINSATPMDALLQSVRALRIDTIFSGVYGRANNSHDSKIANLTTIASVEGVDPHTLLFIGDSEHDYRAAIQVGALFVRFLGTAPGNMKTWSSDAPRSINALQELDQFLT